MLFPSPHTLRERGRVKPHITAVHGRLLLRYTCQRNPHVSPCDDADDVVVGAPPRLAGPFVESPRPMWWYHEARTQKSMTTDDPIVLLVDDLDNDGLLMRVVFERAGFVQPLRFAPGGEEAIAYLRGDVGVNNYKLQGMPAAVLLDLNMPRVNGFQVLEWIRQQPGLRQLRVYILSASSRSEDIERAYELGADSYFVKPSNLAELTHLAKSLLAWLRLSHFAPAPGMHVGQFSAVGGGAALGNKHG